MSPRKLDRKTGKSIKAGWLAALLITAWMLLSPWGAIRHHKLSKDLDRIESRNGDLSDRNRQLRTEIASLTDDPAYIEKVARERYNLLRTGEFVYDFSDR